MSSPKITATYNEKPVTMMIKLPAAIHRDLITYAQALKREGCARASRTTCPIHNERCSRRHIPRNSFFIWFGHEMAQAVLRKAHQSELCADTSKRALHGCDTLVLVHDQSKLWWASVLGKSGCSPSLILFAPDRSTQPDIPVPNTCGCPGGYVGSYSQVRVDRTIDRATGFAVEVVHLAIGEALCNVGAQVKSIGVEIKRGW